MRDAFNKLIRRVLALTIRCPKKPKTKGDILKYALRWYLNNGGYGLCNAIYEATDRFQYKHDLIKYDFNKIPEIFPWFRRDMAIRFFNGRNGIYWWPIEDWKNRYRYMRWLIKEYDGIKL